MNAAVGLRACALFFVIAVAGCEGASRADRGDGPGALLSADASESNGVANDPGLVCVGTLGEVATINSGISTLCAATYEGAVVAVDCAPWIGVQGAGPCGDGFVYYDERYTHGRRCFYDGASHALVGAIVFDDTPWACGNRAFSLRAGTVFECTVPRYSPQCPGDGGRNRD